MRSPRSQRLFATARGLIAGGVDSPVRAFKAVGGSPLFIARGEGPYIYDADGKEYIDYVCSWGPLILGHAHPAVVAAIERAARAGTSFGAPNVYENQLAELILGAMPSLERIRFVSSGTEACMSAVRLARAFTGRDKIVKFAGCYHGHADSMLVAAGSGALTLGTPDSPGIPQAVAGETIVLPFNDEEAVTLAFEARPSAIACVLVEPIAGNMGVIKPKSGFLAHLRRITESFGALLIFDEVMTGFRVAHGGAQQLYSITPDLTCLGKVIGAGLPVGAFGGRSDIMARLAPDGDVYQAGTLSGNPLAMAAGAAQLRLLDNPDVYARLEASGAALERGLSEVFGRSGVPMQFAREGSMWALFFNPEPVVDVASAQRSNISAFAAYFRDMLRQGVYLAPSQFEACFVSLAHSPTEIELTIGAASASLDAMNAAAR